MPAGISFDLVLTCTVSALALLAVWFPLYRGLRLCLEARGATRRLDAAELRRRLDQPLGAPGEPLALLMVRTLVRSLRESSGHPREFVIDATKQYVVNEYDMNFARPISMYANLLPPIGSRPSSTVSPGTGARTATRTLSCCLPWPTTTEPPGMRRLWASPHARSTCSSSTS